VCGKTLFQQCHWREQRFSAASAFVDQHPQVLPLRHSARIRVVFDFIVERAPAMRN
jgi:hypothetical protein